MKRFEVWENNVGQWFWRLRARNGKIVADSGQDYSTHYGALRAAKSVRGANKWPIVQRGYHKWQNRRLA